MSKDFDPKFMQRAIELSRQGALIEKTGGVFGAVVVKDGEVIAEGYNQVVKHNDPTWHAEMQALREAGKKLGSPHLTGCVLYTSAECCPMCLAAAYWADIRTIYYGATVEDALEYGDFADVGIYEEVCKPADKRRIPMIQHLRKEAVEVWKEYHDMPGRVHY